MKMPNTLRAYRLKEDIELLSYRITGDSVIIIYLYKDKEQILSFTWFNFAEHLKSFGCIESYHVDHSRLFIKYKIQHEVQALYTPKIPASFIIRSFKRYLDSFSAFDWLTFLINYEVSKISG